MLYATLLCATGGGGAADHGAGRSQAQVSVSGAGGEEEGQRGEKSLE